MREPDNDPESRLQRILDWCEAYPLSVFPEPDWTEVRRLLGDSLLTRVSASNMRHVIEGVAKIAKGANGIAERESDESLSC